MKRLFALAMAWVSVAAFAQITYTDYSGSITTGGTSQTLAPISNGRVRIAILNPATETENLCVNLTTAASCTPGSSWILQSGQSVVLDSTEAVTVVAATTGHKWIAKAGVGAGFAANGGGSGSGGGGGGAITAASGSFASGALSSGSVASGAFAAGSLASGAGVDGWDLTQGAKADAVCGTATGTCSEVALIKFLNQTVSATNQQLPTTLGPATKANSLTVTGATDDPAALGIGGTADAAATAGSTGSISAKLRTLTGAIGTAGSGGTNVVTVQGNASGTPIPVTTTFGSNGADVAVAVTRTNDTSAYAAGDVIGAATGSTAALTFTALCPLASKPIMITSAELRIDAAAIISGETNYILYLYNVTPPSALGDNTAWDLPSGDRASFLGSVNLGAPADLGSTLYVVNDGINKQILCPASQNVFGYLVTVGAYTPTAQRVYNVTLHSVGL
jgi:hypothetical protein